MYFLTRNDERNWNLKTSLTAETRRKKERKKEKVYVWRKASRELRERKDNYWNLNDQWQPVASSFLWQMVFQLGKGHFNAKIFTKKIKENLRIYK